MKKLGPPAAGYTNARRLTRAEARASGLWPWIVVLIDNGSRQITFWTECKTGGLDNWGAYNRERAREAANALSGFWND